MKDDSLTNLIEISRIFFPAEQVWTVFEVGKTGHLDDRELKHSFPLATDYRFEYNGSLRLDGFMDSKRMGGVDILRLGESGNELQILEGFGRKLRTVRLIDVRKASLGTINRFLLKNGFRYFDDGIFVNKDVAPRYLGILKKRLKRRFRRI